MARARRRAMSEGKSLGGAKRRVSNNVAPAHRLRGPPLADAPPAHRSPARTGIGVRCLDARAALAPPRPAPLPPLASGPPPPAQRGLAPPPLPLFALEARAGAMAGWHAPPLLET